MTPPSLNACAEIYATHLNSIPVEMEVLDVLHQAGDHSVYVLTIDLSGPLEKRYYYVGHTKDVPKKRASTHKSSFRNCRVSTFVGTSVLFTPELLNVTRVKMTLAIAIGGMARQEAKAKEKELSGKLRLLHGNAVLTRPNGPGATL